MSSTDFSSNLTPGRLVAFRAPSGRIRQGRVVEAEWKAPFGNPHTEITVRVDDTTLTITDEDLHR